MGIANKFVILVLLFMSSHALWAQDSLSGSQQYFGVHLSTEGIGLGYTYQFKKPWTAHAEIHWAGYKKAQQIALDNESTVDIDPLIDRASFQAKVGYAFKPGWLSVEAGLGFLFMQKNRLLLSTETGIDSDGLQIAADDFGIVDFEILWSRIQPYLGIRLGRYNPQRKVNVQGILGCHYIGSPKLNIHYEGFLETTNLSEDLGTIENNMKNYSFYPKLGIALLIPAL